ncbi:MAG: MazG nucleotide pyrophosphohydrolase domain-containing protein [Microthrixaceae bacterium]
MDVVGLGPAGLDLTTAGTLELLGATGRCYLRTTRHPAAEQLIESGLAAGWQSFDHLYESLPTFAAVYSAIVDELIEAAGRFGKLVYAVPGSPTVAESTVEALLGKARAPGGPQVVVHPAMSFADLAWARLGIDPVRAQVTLVDGHSFARATTTPGAVLVAQCESALTLSDIKLTLEDPPPERVSLLARLGLPDEVILEVDWADIDRSLEPDHLTSLWIPRLAASAGTGLDGFAQLMAKLRAGDPWKSAQDHDSLRRYLLEETYEVLDALDSYDPESGAGAEELAGELGDLLYQIVFHASLAEEAGWFDLAGVIRAIHEKLVVRHPHMTESAGSAASGDEAPSIDELTTRWEQAKKAEHSRESAFDGIPASLPALARAMAMAKKAAALGLAVPPPPQGYGGTLMAAAFDAIEAGVDPEDALRQELNRAEQVLRASGQ